MAYGYAVYFTERAKNRVVRWDPDTGDADVVAGDPTRTLSDPYGLAFDPDGRLLIADKKNNRICRLTNGLLEALPLLDLDGHRAPLPETRLGYWPQVITPTGLFVEEAGTLLATFADDHTLYRIHPDGRLELLLGIVRNRNYFFTGMRETVPPADLPDTPVFWPTGILGRSDGTIFFIERRYQAVREYHPARGLSCVFPFANHEAFDHEREAPDQGSIADYHPAFPGSLALDADERLYMTDVQHGCVLELNLDTGVFEKVIECEERGPDGTGGPAAMGFGPDETAWLADSGAGAVQGYKKTRSGLWKALPEKLEEMGGQPLQLPTAGSGIVTGPKDLN